MLGVGVSVIRMKEVTGKGGVPMPFPRCVSVPDAGIRLLCASAHRLMEMFAADFHRERGVTGEGEWWDPRRARADAQGGDRGRRRGGTIYPLI